MRSVIVLVIALAGGCKGMGALGHVLGHVGHIAAASGRVLAPMARAVGHAAPLAARVANVAVNTAIAVSQVDPVEVVVVEEPVEHTSVVSGPLIDDGDACNYCPEDLECGACGDVNHVACVLTPPGSYTRCESSFKQHPPGW